MDDPHDAERPPPAGSSGTVDQPPNASKPVPGETPARIGRYQVLDRLGRGGMGEVFEAFDPELQRKVAVKVIRTDRSGPVDLDLARERFLREARAAAGIVHDHVVPVFDFDASDLPYLVMPLLAGENLKDRLEGKYPLTLAEVLRVGRETASGLAAAHAAGVIHRDVKPSNLWLEATPDGWRVRVLDFGLARPIDGRDRLTAPGPSPGTVAYMSPEQLRGDPPLDGRTDLYSLGVVLYEAATGFLPDPGSGESARPPREVNPSIPEPVSVYIKRLLRRQPDDRPATAAQVVEDLAALERGFQSGRPSRRGLWAAAAVAVLLAIGLAAWRFWPNDRGEVPLPVPVVAPLGGSVDLLIHRVDADGSDIAVRLPDPRAMPLRPGDDFKVIAEVNRPAYLYLFWVDETGTALPLYPWTPLQWGTRPATEQPTDKLEVKDPNGNWFKVAGDGAGMETVLLVARTEPLGATDAEVQGWFAGLKPLRFPGEKARVWFEGFDLVRDDTTRAPVYGGEPSRADGPLGLQGTLRQRLGPAAEFSRAVSFSRLGKKGSE